MSALGINEILDRDRVLLHYGSADRGTSEPYIFSKRRLNKIEYCKTFSGIKKVIYVVCFKFR